MTSTRTYQVPGALRTLAGEGLHTVTGNSACQLRDNRSTAAGFGAQMDLLNNAQARGQCTDLCHDPCGGTTWRWQCARSTQVQAIPTQVRTNPDSALPCTTAAYLRSLSLSSASSMLRWRRPKAPQPAGSSEEQRDEPPVDDRRADEVSGGVTLCAEPEQAPEQFGTEPGRSIWPAAGIISVGAAEIQHGLGFF